MQRFLHQIDSESVCYKESCVHAKGANANLIAIGAFVMLILIGLASISQSN